MIIDGKDLFRLYATDGLSLADALILSRDSGFRLDVPAFVKSARLDGWTLEKIQSVLKEAYRDGLGYKDGSLRLLEELTKIAYLDHS